jgi:hypothetical protein
VRAAAASFVWSSPIRAAGKICIPEGRARAGYSHVAEVHGTDRR